MGYLSNSSITIDAILTKKGRALLAQGGNAFKITQFALCDDEISYDLWNPAHPLGSSYYGSVIEAMPILEALPDETQMMKFKLVTLPKKTSRIPVISVSPASITAISPNEIFTIRPSTLNFTGGNSTLGYTAILTDNSVGTLRSTKPVNAGILPTTANWIGDTQSTQSISAVGFEFEFIGKLQLINAKTAQLIIIGNETGGRVVVNITVNKVTTSTLPNTPIVNNKTT